MPDRERPSLPERADVVVIGGGQAGLACGYWLERQGVDYLILDDQSGPGGAWQSTWTSLRLFSPASFSSLPGRPMPAHPDTFPPVEHVLDYLADYEQRYRLTIARPVRVLDTTADDEAVRVRTDAGTIAARYVINATGTWRAPFVPQIEGQDRYRGRQLHSAHYRGPDDFAGERVAVVGGGNSGVQIAADLIQQASAVHLVSLTRLRYLPDDVDGRHLFKSATERIAGNAAEQENQLAGKIVAMPAVRDARERGALRLRAMFDRMTPEGAVIGRSQIEVDSIIWCTGYRPALRHLRSLKLRTKDGVPAVEGQRSVKDPRVAFVGYGDWTGPASATIIGVGRTAKAVVREISAELGHAEGG
ncbi:ArsO family NAD(P)H-dependent flavin-containing monooxygenase [Janibacter sp. GXQ6167]|uniref:ArsO family NAD(P)H-dependent flavin-containing monooxygenase n=1 Tax=Janibacter sp. GXQ6167 TaxID=3240791 RepID=UPI003525ADDE